MTFPEDTFRFYAGAGCKQFYAACRLNCVTALSLRDDSDTSGIGGLDQRGAVEEQGTPGLEA